MLIIRAYETTDFLVVLCECETSSVVLRKEHKLQMSENKLLRKIFASMKDEINCHFKILHNEELMIYTGHLVLLTNIKEQSP